ncbi:MarR family transcriptional regulator [Halorarum halophilum]|uniref:MarR family transcriptional regulator n=1 Tax=Halorarum halophilum TaxID=2743090 RepID=A0A7D5KTK8_9EURY|nr:MarR family transcriptional regulator [Halobaculum halophilum]QLG26400.1 MarR family transcriptional regulator [Halobaculum halophilum]
MSGSKVRTVLSEVWARIAGTLGSSERSDETTGSDPRAGRASERPNPGANHATAIDELVARDRISKKDIRMATGLQPNEFLVELIHHNDGQMWQGELADVMGWSSSSMSRSLNELESAGEIERRQFGRRKRVFLPESKPDSLSDSRFERTERPESSSETTPPRDRESA